MDRREFMLTVAGVTILPGTALAQLVEGKVLEPRGTPTFSQAARYQFRKELTLATKAHLPSYPFLRDHAKKQYFLDGMTRFMSAAEEDGTITDKWTVIIMDDEDVAINYTLKASEHIDEYLKAMFQANPDHYLITFFPKNAF